MGLESLEGNLFVQPVSFTFFNVYQVYVAMSCLGDNPLSAQYDVVRMDLQPSEQYKSVRLVQMQNMILLCVMMSFPFRWF